MMERIVVLTNVTSNKFLKRMVHAKTVIFNQESPKLEMNA